MEFKIHFNLDFYALFKSIINEIKINKSVTLVAIYLFVLIITSQRKPIKAITKTTNFCFHIPFYKKCLKLKNSYLLTIIFSDFLNN